MIQYYYVLALKARTDYMFCAGFFHTRKNLKNFSKEVIKSHLAYHGSFHDGKELYTMSNVKRKDSKNRNLRNGESQRKDGRYVYKYTDIYGKPQFIYSWKLVPTDKTPAGKRDDISLREKETQIGYYAHGTFQSAKAELERLAC